MGRRSRKAEDELHQVDITDDRFDPYGLATRHNIKTGPRRVGRPSKLTNDVVQSMCDHLIAGATIEAAATCSGISSGNVLQLVRSRSQGSSNGLEKAELLDVEATISPDEAEYVEFPARS
jgi:hypothetical protein